jgi:tetratricopeptide (TPR) repeat protein
MIDVYARRATCYYNTGNYSAMKSDAEKILTLDSANADALALLAYFKHKAGNKKEACTITRKQKFLKIVFAGVKALNFTRKALQNLT